MRLSELQHKDIVDLQGRKVGNIIDVIIDQTGKIISLVVEPNKKLIRFSNKEFETEVSWDKIATIGSDVILVKII